MPTFIDLTGQRFGRLLVADRAANRNGRVRWWCKCDCGEIKDITSKTLRNGMTESCGCYARDRAREANTKHGMSYRGEINKITRFYNIWVSMRQRCNNQNKPDYEYYGGRGIKVCDRWSKFENFRGDMHLKYIIRCLLFGEKGTTIDRIDNDGDYTPENCRWTSRKVQANNSRPHYNQRWFEAVRLSDRYIERSNNQKEFARKYEMSQGNLNNSLKFGWKCKGWKVEYI